MPERIPNRNLLWASIVVDELARSGLKAVCIAPGSRSTPLTLAFAQHPGIKVYPHLDERSAAFFALGIALKTDQPVALVCTSGSATANFFPAIVEAHESQVPLIVLTGDRPPELRDSGANQTIDQVKMYGTFALWSVDLALPEADPDPLLIRYLRTTAARAYATANGIRKGVVHLNLPFRKPLEPTLVETDKTDFPVSADDRPFTSISRPIYFQPGAQIKSLADVVSKHVKGLIVCGPNCAENFADEVAELSLSTGYPIVADPLSGVRFGAHISDLPVNVIGSYESFLNSPVLENPDVVFRFGQVPTSKWLNEYLDRAQPKYEVQIGESGVWSDDSHRTTEVIQGEPRNFCYRLDEAVSLSNRLEQPGDSPHRSSKELANIEWRWLEWREQWQMLEASTWDATAEALNSGDDFDAAFIYDLIEALPDNAHLFVGNSLAIRHVDQFGKPSAKNLHVFGNRGASGIDGNISTGLGVASQTGEPLVLLVGDITFYHDMNGLFAVKNLDLKNVTIVLMNNN
ncbi:MAG TPA: 2-succinyl-5-enolpyruvyl-6-hydroxy-3-cyclohexene-1-carboxylic-acid synthase, partial [Phototrophicaceae bacterium]|nr:2-succinyl-5-enolpyruvyl-6-hydroxy-3-cyclohexene-1-carboxylic-acid synthase [Phototrophicaceae bacterium]